MMRVIIKIMLSCVIESVKSMRTRDEPQPFDVRHAGARYHAL